MVELWNIGFQKDISHFNFIVNPVCGGNINPTLHFPLRAASRSEGRLYELEARTHYSTIPVFHHSNCERSEQTCFDSVSGSIAMFSYRIDKSQGIIFSIALG